MWGENICECVCGGNICECVCVWGGGISVRGLASWHCVSKHYAQHFLPAWQQLPPVCCVTLPREGNSRVDHTG